jgi:hypothetical protein
MNRYILNSEKIVEPITLEYTNGIISAILMPFKHPLSTVQYEYIISFVPYFEENVANKKTLGTGGLYITKEIGANVKVSMFCTHFMAAYNGVKYSATAIDGKKIRPFKVTDELLAFYFKSDNFLFKGKHTIANFTKYYNELVIEFNDQGKSKYPDHWSEKFQNNLKTQQEISDYWTHLRGLGLEPKKDRIGKTVDWVKKQ